MNSRQIFRRHARMNQQHIGLRRIHRDRRKARHRVVRKLVVQRGVDRVRADRAAADRVAVGSGARQLGRADRAALPRLVLDHDRLAERGAEPFADRARQNVGRAARSERNDVADRLVRPVRCWSARWPGAAASASAAPIAWIKARRCSIMSPPLCTDLISVYDRATLGSTKIVKHTDGLLHDRRYAPERCDSPGGARLRQQRRRSRGGRRTI